MKKQIIFLTAFMALALSAVAQDTVYLRGIYNEGYFYYGNYSEFWNGDFIPMYDKSPGGGGEIAKKFYSSDTLTVYGIAAGLKQIGPYDYYLDQTLTNTYEYLRIYYPTADSMQWLRQAQVHLGTTPVSYYGTFNLGGIDPSRHIIPVYERYFSAPVTVVDTFYVGRTNFACIPFVDSNGHTWDYPRPSIGLCIIGTYTYGCNDELRGYFYHSDGNQWFDDHYRSRIFHFIFPILLPAPDDYEWDTIAAAGDTSILASDTIAAGDTLIVCDTVIVCDTLIVGYDTIINYDTIITYDTLLALPERGLLGRLVGVMPNPAGSTAKVVSSFGLTMVEAFNMAGERLCTLRLPDAPLTTTLDVSRWPSGAYLLRIHTPQGVVTKKLIVRR